MKPKIFLLFLSIFSNSYICNGQARTANFRICDEAVGNVSIKEVNNWITNNCGKITFYDAGGNQLKITSYTFAIAPKNGGTAYFEIVDGNMFSAEIKNRLKNASPGSLVVVSNISCLKRNGTKGLSNGFSFKIIAEE